MYWWYSKPIPVTLLPYTIFSLFHTLTFVRTTIIPQIFPQGPVAQGQTPQQSPFAKQILVWVKANYDPAMKLVSYIELLILARIVIGVLTLQNSILSLIVFAHFIRQRYYQSAYTRDAIGWLNGKINGFATRPGMPPVVHQGWEFVRRALTAWAGSGVIEPQPAAPRPAPAGNSRRESRG